MVSRNCPTELYKKALNVIKLKASPKVIGCFTEALKRRLSEPRDEEMSCLQGLKQACCHYPAFTCQLASPSPPAVACLNRYPLPESSLSLEYWHCETVLCWSGFPRLLQTHPRGGLRAVPVDGLPCLSAQGRPVRWLSAPWLLPLPRGILRTPGAPSVLKGKQRTIQEAWA